MTEIKTEIPDFLSKHGITKLEDNVPPGHQVKPSSSLFFTLFGDELMNSNLVKKVPAKDPDNSK